MPRPRLRHPRSQQRAQVRNDVMRLVRDQLASENVFNPTKPEQGAFSELVEDLLVKWLRQRLGDNKVQNLLHSSDAD